MDSKDKKQQTFKNKNFMASIEFAIMGFKTAFKEERNMRAHCFFAFFAIIAGLIFKINRYEWLWLLLAIFLVIVMEMINTTFENLVDLITKKHFDPIAKKVKDMAAAVVLFTACFAVIVGILIFVPKIWQLLQLWITN